MKKLEWLTNTDTKALVRKARLECSRIYAFFDKQLIYAASLSFYTIFALIPMLLILFSVLLNLPQFQDEVLELKELIRELHLAGIESVNVSDAIKTGALERDKDIEAYIETLENLGKADIHMVCYNFMPVFDWTRTELERKRDDGSTVLAYNQATIDSMDPEKMFYNMLSSSVKKIKHKEGGDEMAMSILEEIMGDEFEDFKAEVYEELKKEVLEKATAEGEAVGMEIGRAKGIAEGMAKGIEEGRVRGIEEGRARGIEEGRVRGIEEGRVRGIEEGRAEERLNFLRILLKENSAFDISSKYGIPLNEVSAVERSLRL